MAFVEFTSLKVDTTKPYLKEKGYWFYEKNLNSRMMGVPIPLRRAAVWLNLFIDLAVSSLFVLFLGRLFSPEIDNFVNKYGWFWAGGVLGIVVLSRLALAGKVYRPGYKEYKALNYGKRDGLYTSEESLYTTSLEGVYLCATCAAPIASTDDKLGVKGHTVEVGKLFDEGRSLAINDNSMSCTVCGTELGSKLESGGAALKGENIVLDAGELHYIYPIDEEES